MAKLLNLGGIASMLTGLSARAHGGSVVSGVNTVGSWPTPGQPVTPIAPPGAPSLIFPYSYGQNLTYTPRSDSVYTAADLQQLSTYPLARICIDNSKDILCKTPWSIELRKIPGESDSDVAARRKAETKGDENILKLSNMFEWPDGQHDWAEWLRPTLEDMLVMDGASTLIQRNRRGKVLGFEWTSGAPIAVYVDSRGSKPKPPSPAYAQLWQGMPRTNLTSDQLVYKPRNIVTRMNVVSSFLYGLSPTESVADEIKIGMGRLAFVMAYYDAGSMGNMIHVVPPGVPPDKVKEAMQWVNSEMAGNYANRRQYRIIQGFQDDGKQDQLVFPQEPVLADVFDDLIIRKLSFAFGTSPQRLLKQMNRGSADSAQSAANDEGIQPWVDWVRRYANYIIQRVIGLSDYEMVFGETVLDYINKAKAEIEYMKEGAITRNEVRDGLGRDASDNPLADKLCITTPNGTVELGQVIVSGKPDKGGDGSGTGGPTPAPAPSKTKLVQRGEV